MTDNKLFTSYLAQTNYHQGCAAAAIARFAEDGDVTHLDEARELLDGEVENVSSMDALGDLNYRAATTINTIVYNNRDDARIALEKFIEAVGETKPRATKRAAAKPKAKPAVKVEAETTGTKAEDVAETETTDTKVEAVAEAKPEPEAIVDPEPAVEAKPEPEAVVEDKPEPKAAPKAAPAISSDSFGAAPISSQGF